MPDIAIARLQKAVLSSDCIRNKLNKNGRRRIKYSITIYLERRISLLYFVIVASLAVLWPHVVVVVLITQGKCLITVSSLATIRTIVRLRLFRRRGGGVRIFLVGIGNHHRALRAHRWSDRRDLEANAGQSHWELVKLRLFVTLSRCINVVLVGRYVHAIVANSAAYVAHKHVPVDEAAIFVTLGKIKKRRQRTYKFR
jgi:hypothetical protein